MKAEYFDAIALTIRHLNALTPERPEWKYKTETLSESRRGFVLEFGGKHSTEVVADILLRSAWEKVTPEGIGRVYSITATAGKATYYWEIDQDQDYRIPLREAIEWIRDRVAEVTAQVKPVLIRLNSLSVEQAP